MPPFVSLNKRKPDPAENNARLQERLHTNTEMLKRFLQYTQESLGDRLNIWMTDLTPETGIDDRHSPSRFDLRHPIVVTDIPLKVPYVTEKWMASHGETHPRWINPAYWTQKRIEFTHAIEVTPDGFRLIAAIHKTRAFTPPHCKAANYPATHTFFQDLPHPPRHLREGPVLRLARKLMLPGLPKLPVLSLQDVMGELMQLANPPQSTPGPGPRPIIPGQISSPR